MKEMTAEDLFGLKYGDVVTRWSGGFSEGAFKELTYVGRIPKSERYLIFCSGDSLTSLYINPNGTFYHTWFSGEYDFNFVAELLIEKHKDAIEDLKLCIELEND